MCFPSLRFMMVSMIRWVVMTFPQRCWRASFTSPILKSHKLLLISSFSSRALNLSSIPFTYWETSAFNFSGRIQNIFPICFGLIFSSYQRWRISHTFPKKFQASYVQGLATGTFYSSFFSSLKRGSSGTRSGSSLFRTAYCFSMCTLSLITVSPVREGQSKEFLELTCWSLLNSASYSLLSSKKSISYSSRGLRLLKIKVVKILLLSSTISILKLLESSKV